MIKIGITYRLFLSILAAVCLALLSMFFITDWSLRSGFFQYLHDKDRTFLDGATKSLGEAYAAHGGWSFLRADPSLWMGRLIRPEFFGPEEGPGHGVPPPFPPPPMNRPGWESKAPLPPFPPDGGPGRHAPPLVVLDENKEPLFGRWSEGEKVSLRPIVHDMKIVGYVGLHTPPKLFLDPLQLNFLRQQKSVLVVAALVLIGGVSIFAFPLASRLLRPIRALVAGTKELARGRYDIRVPISSSDELGELGRAFNVMATTLEKNEEARRQWVADISHELRTPLAILIGEIEGLIEGVRETTPEAIRSLHAESLRLHRLVDDLYQLALSDLGSLTYRKKIFDPADILDDVIEPFLAQFQGKDIRVEQSFPDHSLHILADWQRLRQLFINLLDNSLKYTDPGGTLAVRLSYVENSAIVEVEDSAPGVPEEHLHKLFERLYRVDFSRNRTWGGSGLGLAICKSIVEAHEGAITAKQSSLGGILIRVSLPLVSRQS